MQSILDSQRRTNVAYFLHVEEDKPGSDDSSSYVRVIDKFASGVLDFVLVDGIHRAKCVLRAMEKIKPSGVLVIDNVNWYLPSNSKAPNSRSMREGPLDAEWERIAVWLATWRCVWTSNGVFDTAIYFKRPV